MDKRSPHRLGSNTRLVSARTISAPSYHEGVGNALRSAFETGFGVPDDFARLLKQIDR
jgi:hypothetical protein